MSSFEPVLKLKNQKPQSERAKLTPLKKRTQPEEKLSVMDKEKAKKLVMLAKLIKNI